MILAIIRPWWLLVLTAFVVGCGAPSGTGDNSGRSAPTVSESGMAQVVGILDYVSSDYAGAVRDGRVVSESEFHEQLGLVDAATAIAPSHIAEAIGARVLDRGPALVAA